MTTKAFEDGKVFEIDDVMVKRYFDRMTGRIFKIIPIREEGEFPVQPYLVSLLREMLGAKDLMEAINQDERFLQCLNILNYLSENPELDVKTLKSEVFHILNLVKKISKTYVKPAKEETPAPASGKEEDAEA